MNDFFGSYGALILFLHVLSAIIWVGGMIAVRTAVHPVIARGGLTASQMLQSNRVKDILTPKQRLGINLQITGRLFNLVLPFILTLFITGLTMAIALDGHHGEQKILFLSKEIIWTIMAINYGYMYYLRSRAWKYFEADELKAAKAQVALIPNLLLPINIVLGIVALWMGVLLRGM